MKHTENLPSDDDMREIYVLGMEGEGYNESQLREQWDAWLRAHDRAVQREILAVFSD